MYKINEYNSTLKNKFKLVFYYLIFSCQQNILTYISDILNCDIDQNMHSSTARSGNKSYFPTVNFTNLLYK